jgi:hypothetical protein
MRFAIIHCRQCAQHVWVPENKLGARGRCPECGASVQTPGYVSPDELVQGPNIMQDVVEQALTGART